MFSPSASFSAAPARAPTAPAARVVLAVHLAAAVFLVLPLVAVGLPLLADYPEYLARAQISSNHNENQFFAGRYEVALEPRPGIVAEVLLAWIADIVPFLQASKVVLVLCVLITFAGVALLSRALFGVWSIWSATAALFAYHAALIQGSIAFCLGTGLMLIGTSVWISSRYLASWWRIMLGSLMGLAICLGHWLPFVVYALAIIGYELTRARDVASLPDGRRRVRAYLGATIASLVLPALALGQEIEARMLLDASYGGLAEKFEALVAPIASGRPRLDSVTMVLLLLLTLAGWRLGHLTLSRRIAPAVIILIAAFVLTPSIVGGFAFNQHLMIILALLLLAGTQLELAKAWTNRLLFGLLAVLFMSRLAVLTQDWIAFSVNSTKSAG